MVNRNKIPRGGMTHSVGNLWEVNFKVDKKCIKIWRCALKKDSRNGQLAEKLPPCWRLFANSIPPTLKTHHHQNDAKKYNSKVAGWQKSQEVWLKRHWNATKLCSQPIPKKKSSLVQPLMPPQAWNKLVFAATQTSRISGFIYMEGRLEPQEAIKIQMRGIFRK